MTEALSMFDSVPVGILHTSYMEARYAASQVNPRLEDDMLFGFNGSLQDIVLYDYSSSLPIRIS